MTKNLLLLSLCLLVTGTLSAQSNSLLWEISGNGLTKPSYIYGTMHVSDKLAFHLTDSFFVALKSADVIALESNPETWIANDFGNPDKSDNNSYGYSDYNNYSYGNYNDFYTLASNIYLPDASTYYNAFADNSGLINGYLYRYDSRRTEYEEETYLDLFIFQCGKKLTKEIAALEAEQEVLKLLVKAYEPDKKDKEAEEKAYLERQRMIEKFEENGSSIYDQIDEAYRDGNLEKLDSLELITSPSKKFRQFFIEERNANMMRRMDSILQSGKVVFTGIGAAHLPGSRGALAMLREMGYTVKPVKGKISGKSIKEKDKIDAIYYSHPTTKQYSSDSLFSLSVPGKLYEIGGSKTDEFYLYPDMSNSAYYSVLRIAHYSATKNQTPDMVLDDIDKLLFENIPGDITSKTAIKSNTGYPGFDIISRTKRGNYLHIKLFVTPLETIIFKASGLGEFVVKSKEMQTFFNSIQFTNIAADSWSTFSPDWGLFSVSAPNVRTSKSIEQDASIYSGQTISVMQAADKNGFYWLNTYVYNDNDFIEEDSFELARIGNVFAEQFKKNKYENIATRIAYSGHYPSMEMQFKGKDDYLHIKTSINGPYYVLMCAFTKSAETPSAYFNSFQFKNITYAKAFEWYNDTTLNFKVLTIAPKVDTLLTIDEVQSINYSNNNYDYYGDDDEEDEDLSYLASNKNMLFSSETSPENVFVRQHKYHKFYAVDSAELYWAKFDSIHNWNSTMRITHRIFTERDSIYTLSFILTDTNSTRGIYKKYILKNDYLFQLATTIDTLTGPSLFVQQFYDSFTPDDSVYGRTIFNSIASKYFEQLHSEDTILFKQALTSVEMVHLNDNDAPALIAFIKSEKYKGLKLADKEKFIDLLSELKHNEVIPFLKQMYVEALDTSVIQLAVLYALTTQQSTEATAAFIELLYQETPLANKGNTLTWVFQNYDDSLELAAKLYPQLLDFTSFPEYQYATYKLLAQILRDNPKNLKLYADNHTQIIAEAIAELKRSLINTQDSNNKNKYGYFNTTNDLNFDKLTDLADGYTYILNSFNGGDYKTSNSDYGYSRSYDSYSSDNLTDSLMKKYCPWAKSLQDYYTILLTPYYKEPGVQKYFEKIWLSKDDKLKYRTALTLLASDLPVPDSVWTNMQKSRKLRYEIINKLQQLDAESRIDTTYANQPAITEGCLYPYEFKEDKDAVEFITKRLVTTANHSGYIYFYKSKMGRDKTWNLDCIGLQPEDTAKFNIEPMFVFYGDAILDEKNLEEQIDEIIKSIELIGRNRVVMKLGSDNYDYDY